MLSRTFRIVGQTTNSLADFLKLSVYTAFFCVLLVFYGLPIHIMRDLFMTTRSFVKRLTALLKYKQALRDMNRYPDATEEDLTHEDTCIICREEMRPWDPNAGQLERHRPKKLPCGHILHFGCLKSWLERQQVCPTCRSSVVAEQQPRNPNYRHRMAFHIAPNGQNQAGGANGGPAPGVQDAQLNGQAGQGGQQNAVARAAMRYINLGPIRLGFAQGQNVAELANRMGVDLNDGNAPVAPQPNVPAANPTDLGTMEAVRNRLLEVDQRIHQEVREIQQGMVNVQNAQTELHLLDMMSRELARLREMNNRLQQAQQPQPPPAQNGHAVLPTPTPAGGVPPPIPPPMMFPQGPLPPPGQLPLPPFPSVHNPFIPRINSPNVTRHVAPVNATSIPSGSSDLPEGVVIPPGWSLLPLQRLDQAAAAAPGAPMAGGPSVQANIHDPGHHSTGDVPAPQVSTNHSPPVPSQIATDPVVAPQVEVAAPTPLAPNWSGPASLFGGIGGNGNGNNSSGSLPNFGGQAAGGSSRSVSETREVSSTERAEGGGAGEQQQQQQQQPQATEVNDHGEGSSKGKVPAATVEDAED